jgi:hypothetical protein
MRAGGNKKLNDFLAAHGVPADLGRTDIRGKYDNDVAEYFRETIEAERDNTAAPTRAIPTYRAPGSSSSRSSSSSSSNSSKNGGDSASGCVGAPRPVSLFASLGPCCELRWRAVRRRRAR